MKAIENRKKGDIEIDKNLLDIEIRNSLLKNDKNIFRFISDKHQ